MKIFNLNGDEWDRTEERKGWRSKDAWVGHHIGSELIGGSMYEVEAGRPVLDPSSGLSGRTDRGSRP